MENKIRNFRDLNIWQNGKEIVKAVYSISRTFPKYEIYSLSEQMQRAAISIPSNIAEGFNRLHNKEYKQFLFVSLGSCGELETQIEIAFELNYMDNETKNKLLEKIDYESRMTRNLIKKLV